MPAPAGFRGSRWSRPSWIGSLDSVVLTLHHNGFLQSLIFHVALLLALALTAVQTPQRATAVRLGLAFDATPTQPLDAPDVALAAELPAEPAGAAGTAFVEPLVAVAWDGPDSLAPSIEALDLDDAERVAEMRVDELLADVRSGISAADFAAVPAGRRGPGFGAGGGDGGFGGELGRRLKAAGARTGDVQVSIAWDNLNDVDVHVMVEATVPRRGISMINFSNPRGACGGWLDVDQNVVPMTAAAVENVFWARGAAPYGRYTVYVHQFRNWGGADPTRVHVAVLVDGRQTHHSVVVHSGSGPVAVTTFVRRPGAVELPDGDRFDDGSLIPTP